MSGPSGWRLRQARAASARSNIARSASMWRRCRRRTAATNALGAGPRRRHRRPHPTPGAAIAARALVPLVVGDAVAGGGVGRVAGDVGEQHVGLVDRRRAAAGAHHLAQVELVERVTVRRHLVAGVDALATAAVGLERVHLLEGVDERVLAERVLGMRDLLQRLARRRRALAARRERAGARLRRRPARAAGRRRRQQPAPQRHRDGRGGAASRRPAAGHAAAARRPAAPPACAAARRRRRAPRPAPAPAPPRPARRDRRPAATAPALRAPPPAAPRGGAGRAASAAARAAASAAAAPGNASSSAARVAATASQVRSARSISSPSAVKPSWRDVQA